MSDLTTVARPYAKAVFDFALEQSNANKDALNHWAEMLDFLSQLIQNEDIQAFLLSAVSVEKLAESIIQLGEGQLDEYGQNLVRLMAQNGRLRAISTVYEAYKRYVDDYRAISDVDVVSAFALTDSQQKNIMEAMEKRLARRVKLNCSIDKSLIAGLIIRTNDFVIDGSSRGQLQHLARELRL